MRAWTKDYKMLVTVVMILSLCSYSCHVTADTDLEVLEEVRDALSHADRSLEALNDLLDEVMTEEPPETTSTESSNSTTTTTTTTTTTPTTTTAPTTTTTTTPTTTTTTTTTSTPPLTTTTPTTVTTTTTPTTTTTTTTPSTITTPTTTTTTTTPTMITTTTTPTTTTTTTTPTTSTTPTTTTTTTTPTTTTTTTTPTTTTTTTTPTTTTTTTTPSTTTTTTTPTTTTTTTTPTTTTTTPSSTTTTLTTTIPSATPPPSTTKPTNTSTEPKGTEQGLTIKEFPSDLRFVQIWNSDSLLHGRTVRDSHGQSARDVLAFPVQALALAKHSSDTEHFQKQESVNKADLAIMKVPAERLQGQMSSLMPDPWWMRVNMHLSIMGNLIAEIIGGSVDMSHAEQLEEEASIMDELVEEGRNDTSLVMEEKLDLELLDSVQENLYNASDLVDEMISDEKADNTEMVVTIVMLSLLFVVVLTGLIVAFIQPWAKKSGLKTSGSKWKADNAVAKDARTFPDARFMQHSHIYTDPYQSHVTKV